MARVRLTLVHEYDLDPTCYGVENPTDEEMFKMELKQAKDDDTCFIEMLCENGKLDLEFIQ